MKVFNIEARSDFAGWSRYNVFLTALCTLPDGSTGYVTNDGKTGAASLATPPCESVEVYLNVVAREFPASAAVAASPPFDVSLVVDGQATTFKADQFGGLSIKTPLLA